MAGAGRALVHDQHRARRHLRVRPVRSNPAAGPEAPSASAADDDQLGIAGRTDDGRCRVTGDDRRLDLDVRIVLAVAGELRAQ